MKININVDITPDEFKELFIPGEKQQEFMTKMFEVYSLEMQKHFMANLSDWQWPYKNYQDFISKSIDNKK